MRGLANFVMRGTPQAAAVAAGFGVLAFLLPPVVLLSGAAIALITLRRGPQHALKLLLLATVGCGMLAWLLVGAPTPGLILSLLYWAPLLLLAVILRNTISLALTLQVMVLLGFGLLLMLYLLLGNPEIWWTEMTRDMLRQMNEAGMFPDPEVAPALAEFFRTWAVLAPGQLIFSALLAIVLGLLLGRWWQALLYNPGGFQQEFHNLRLGQPAAITMVALLLLSLLIGQAQPWILNLTLIAGLIYVLQGLAIVHGAVGRAGLSTAWLVTFYVALLFILPLWQFLLLFAVADTWIDVRARIKPSV